MSFSRCLLTTVCLCLLSSPALAFDFLGDDEEKMFELHGEFSELFLWRNDSDFDSTAPVYDAEGQSVGSITSFFKPQITYRPFPNVQLFYESELGMNQWSKNSPDQWYPAAGDFMVYKHREFWARLQLDIFDIKAGYQRVRDPSDLFLSHWMGAVSAGVDLMRFRGNVIFGQLPDSTYEGIRITDNNFMHDNMMLGVNFSYDFIMDELTMDIGYYYLHDGSVVGKPLNLHVPYLGLAYKGALFHARLYGVLQAGAWENSGVNEIDQSVLAWAVTARAGLTSKWLDIDLNAFLLSPDDEYDGNSRMGNFFYSGKNSSATMLLTEDEIRDRYDNFDELLSGMGTGGQWRSFFLNRAGLGVIDLSATGKLLDWLKVQLVAGVGIALQEKNAGGDRYAGFETDLIVRATALKKADIIVAGQLFLPGAAAAAYINHADLNATEYLLGIQAGMVLKF